MKKILLLEDDRELASHWQQLLEDNGHRVVVFHTATEAIQYIKEAHVNVVISDMLIRDELGMLTAQGGLTLLSHISLHVKPRPLVIVITGASPDLNLVRHAEALGADHFASKPADAQQILGWINAV